MVTFATVADSRSSKQDDGESEWIIIIDANGDVLCQRWPARCRQRACAWVHISHELFIIIINRMTFYAMLQHKCDCRLMIADDIICSSLIVTLIQLIIRSCGSAARRSFILIMLPFFFFLLVSPFFAHIVCCLSWALTWILISTHLWQATSERMESMSTTLLLQSRNIVANFIRKCVFTCAWVRARGNSLAHRRTQKRFRGWEREQGGKGGGQRERKSCEKRGSTGLAPLPKRNCVAHGFVSFIYFFFISSFYTLRFVRFISFALGWAVRRAVAKQRRNREKTRRTFAAFILFCPKCLML